MGGAESVLVPAGTALVAAVAKGIGAYIAARLRKPDKEAPMPDHVVEEAIKRRLDQDELELDRLMRLHREREARLEAREAAAAAAATPDSLQPPESQVKPPETAEATLLTNISAAEGATEHPQSAGNEEASAAETPEETASDSETTTEHTALRADGDVSLARAGLCKAQGRDYAALEINPAGVVAIKGPSTAPATTSLRLRNTTPQRCAFKIHTSSHAHFTVWPNVGTLERQEQIVIHIKRAPISVGRKPPMLIVLSAEVPEDSTDPMAAWAAVKSARTTPRVVKLKVLLQPVDDELVEGTKASEGPAKASGQIPAESKTADEASQGDRTGQGSKTDEREVHRRQQRLEEERRRGAEASARYKHGRPGRTALFGGAVRQNPSPLAQLGDSPAAKAARLRSAARRKLGIDARHHYNVGVCGPAGAGKSSIINAARSMRDGASGAAQVGVTETTHDITGYPCADAPELILWDIPGCGTRARPAKEYFWNKFLFVFDHLLSSGRLTAHEVAILKLARRCEVHAEVPASLVRTRANVDIDNLMREQGMTEEEAKRHLRAKVGAEMEENLAGEVELLQDLPVFIVSARAWRSCFYEDLVNYAMDEAELQISIDQSLSERRHSKQ